jgi:hypothetical protein
MLSFRQCNRSPSDCSLIGMPSFPWHEQAPPASQGMKANRAEFLGLMASPYGRLLSYTSNRFKPLYSVRQIMNTKMVGAIFLKNIANFVANASFQQDMTPLRGTGMRELIRMDRLSWASCSIFPWTTTAYLSDVHNLFSGISFCIRQ